MAGVTSVRAKAHQNQGAEKAEIAYNSKFAIYGRDAAELGVGRRRGAGCNWTSTKYRNSCRTDTRFC